ncbi:rna-directed dna polymerase from mobile element jockey- hypothetical protein [Limosa lapponica baueri]|uniref:Reverse transcriptase domain-containing protein n=1 Tax=Limosa lapponica baueri TaxID=1758121 RepID=A0A2I0TJM1_LIMLA|nr:rna-directed dna polymerase from mobile element jockey- hypothetical protein [Limosa lapponica baueri]
MLNSRDAFGFSATGFTALLGWIIIHTRKEWLVLGGWNGFFKRSDKTITVSQMSQKQSYWIGLLYGDDGWSWTDGTKLSTKRMDWILKGGRQVNSKLKALNFRRGDFGLFKDLLRRVLWGEVPKDWKKANVIPIFSKGRKEDPGNSTLLCLTLIPRKLMEQLVLETISRHMKDKKVSWTSHGSTKGKCYLTNLIIFYDEMIGLETTVNIVYLDFSKAFNTLSRKILIEKLLIYRLDEQTVRLIKN